MLSYEKRICLLKTTDNIKSKALDKLKEINNKIAIIVVKTTIFR